MVLISGKLLVITIEIERKSDEIFVRITKARNAQNDVRDVHFAAFRSQSRTVAGEDPLLEDTQVLGEYKDKEVWISNHEPG